MTSEGNYGPHESREQVEERLHRLEQAIAAMQDTKLMEERLLERMKGQLESSPAAAAPPMATIVPPENHAANDMLVNAGMTLLPGALRAVSSGINSATDPRNYHSQRPSMFSAQSWLLLDVIQELRTFGMMLLDFRFHPSWTVKTVPVCCLVLLILNFIFLGGIFHLFDVIPIVIGYKALSREAARYRVELPYMPPRP
jgi:hypothetical protein